MKGVLNRMEKIDIIKSKTRPALTFEETRKSAETYLEQVTKIYPLMQGYDSVAINADI